MSNTTGTENTYRVSMVCLNCGANAQMEFAKGKEVPLRTTCSNCGCHTMQKKFGERKALAETCDVFFNGREYKP